MTGMRIEELIVSFIIETEIEYTVSMGDDKVSKIKQSGGINTLDLLKTTAQIMKDFGEKFVIATADNQCRTIKSFIRRSTQYGRWQRSMSIGNLCFQCGGNLSFNLIALFIRELVPSASIDWDCWVKAYMSMPGFSQAWVADSEYQYWQNMRALELYAQAGKTTDSLPLRHNGLPDPLAAMEVDTSKNLGHWDWFNGYMDGIGRKMWLSPIFWDRVGEKRKITVLHDKILEARALPNGVVCLSSPEPFVDDATKEIQQHVRRILYE